MIAWIRRQLFLYLSEHVNPVKLPESIPMSHALHIIAKNVPGYGPIDNRCLPCSGVSGRAVALSPCSSLGDHRIHSQVKFGSLKCVCRGTNFMCRAGSSGHRRNPDFSKQKHGFRGRNRQNVDRENFESLDESEVLSSKNGPLLSLSSSPKFQATAAPGPREKEIVELFRKVQAQLRERAAVKEDKKIEASQGKAKESETVDSLLKLLRKHSVEQGKRKNSSGSQKDLNLDKSNGSGAYSEDKSSSFFSSNNRNRDEAKEPPTPTLSRPASNFRRKSPVPQVRYQSIYSSKETANSEDTINSVSHLNQSEMREISSVESTLEPEPVLESEPEPEEELDSETEPELEPEAIYQDTDVFDEFSEDESPEIDEASNDVEEDKEEQNEQDNLSLLKLAELRALAKARGLKGFSKMKKGDLLELLNSSSA